MRDYEKVFSADTRPARDIFDLRCIQRNSGCVIVVKPDQYVADIMPLTATERLAAFFGGFIARIPPRQSASEEKGVAASDLALDTDRR